MNFSIFSADNLSEEDRQKIAKKEKYECQLCHALFAQGANFERHLERSHTNNQIHKCSICDITKCTKQLLSAHMNLHTREIKYRCELCPRFYYWPATLKTHRKIRHSVEKQGKEFACIHCDKTMRDPVEIIQHKRVHSSEWINDYLNSEKLAAL